MRDFTIGMYEQLLICLIQSGYRATTVEQYLSNKSEHSPTVILRHDIDRRVYKAIKFSQIEFKVGISATYYFRYPNTFQPEIIRAIGKQGHEIGYHYEVMSKSAGDPVVAKDLFVQELELFRSIYPISTVCMHGAPLSKVDNRDFWQYYTFEEFGLSGEAYLSMDGVEYFSDTGRTWSQKHKIRDRIDHKNQNHLDGVSSTRDLITYIQEKRPPLLYILTHPERWAQSISEWTILWGVDAGVNLGKNLIRVFR